MTDRLHEGYRLRWERSGRSAFSGQIYLRILHQFLDPKRIRLGVAMTRQRIGAAGRLDQYIRPDDPGFDMHRRHLAQADADLVEPEPRAFATADRLVIDLD